MAITAGDTAVRDATIDDVDFVAWAMLAASRSHLERGCWEYLFDTDERTILRFLAALAVTDQVHLFHHSLFQIAEVDGVPAAAMCGYDPETQGQQQYLEIAPAACEAAGITIDGDFERRVEVFAAGWPAPVVERRWVVENVATRPELRRRGLSELLLRQMIERGHAKGFGHAQIGVYIGNEPARRAYVKAGFVVVAEARDPRWDTDMGCPGTEMLLRSI